MADKAYTGISFPFRIGVKGGVVISSTDANDFTHLIEGIEQILMTAPLERGMEYHFSSDIDTDIFSNNDISSQTLISHQIEQALLNLEDRISVESVDVTSDKGMVYATINFKVLRFNTQAQTTLEVGETLI